MGTATSSGSSLLPSLEFPLDPKKKQNTHHDLTNAIADRNILSNFRNNHVRLEKKIVIKYLLISRDLKLKFHP